MLCVGLVCSYVWYWFGAEHAADLWNIAGAVHTSFLLFIVGLVFRSPEVWAVVALLLGFKLMVIGCNAWYVLDPWPIGPGEAMCSARLNLPLGGLGLGLGALLVASIAGEKKP